MPKVDMGLVTMHFLPHLLINKQKADSYNYMLQPTRKTVERAIASSVIDFVDSGLKLILK
jgi:hypothetical protein